VMVTKARKHLPGDDGDNGHAASSTTTPASGAAH